MSTYRDRIVFFQHGDHPGATYRAVVQGQTWEVRVDERAPRYALVVDGQEVDRFDDWPAGWRRPGHGVPTAVPPPRPANAARYYAVNDRPVKHVPTAEGGLDVLVFDWKTGEFVRDMSYLSRVFEPGKDVDEFTETEFEAYVARLRADLGRKS